MLCRKGRGKDQVHEIVIFSSLRLTDFYDLYIKLRIIAQ